MRRDGTMRLADFVSAILHLTMAFDLFKSKETSQDNQLKMGLNEVSVCLFVEFVNYIINFLSLFLSVSSGSNPY